MKIIIEIKPEIIEVPGILFRGRKIYIESRDNKDDQIVIEKFIDFLEHLTGLDFRRQL